MEEYGEAKLDYVCCLIAQHENSTVNPKASPENYRASCWLHRVLLPPTGCFTSKVTHDFIDNQHRWEE